MDGGKVESLFEHDSRIFILLFKLLSAIKKPSMKLNKSVVKHEGILIIFDANLTLDILTRLKESSQAKRLILFILNPIKTIGFNISDARKMGYEIWSYSFSQCIEYNLKYKAKKTYREQPFSTATMNALYFFTFFLFVSL